MPQLPGHEPGTSPEDSPRRAAAGPDFQRAAALAGRALSASMPGMVSGARVASSPEGLVAQAGPFHG